MNREPAERVISRCRTLAGFSESSPGITRTYLSPPFHDCHEALATWASALDMQSTVDAAGNFRGIYPGTNPTAGRLLIGSHIDTVPNAGAFDGVLGVMLGFALVEALKGKLLPFEIELIAFSEEEGVRFATPFLGSRAVAGTLSEADLNLRDAQGISVSEAIRHFGLDPQRIPQAKMATSVFGYLEFHIEQGPVLESENLSLAAVDAIAGQSRFELTFTGSANHAGTTPMSLRHDALAAAAEWIVHVEQTAKQTPALVATVGKIEVHPNAANVVPGIARVSLDIRHRLDPVRLDALHYCLNAAQSAADRRNLQLDIRERLNQPAVELNPRLTALADKAIAATGQAPYRITSGAGHDAMILAAHVPAAMIFLRSPAGISHHPDETVLLQDVQNAISAGLYLLNELAAEYN